MGGRFAAERHKADDLAVAGRAYRAVHDYEVWLLAGQQVAGLGGIGGKQRERLAHGGRGHSGLTSGALPAYDQDAAHDVNGPLRAPGTGRFA